MKTTVRRYIWYKDIWFQLQILTDKTIQHYMFDNMLGVLRFFLPWTYDIKLICFIHKNGKKKRVGIAKFTQRKENLYSIAGFIPTKLHNRGYGLYSGVAIIKYFFEHYPYATIHSCSASYNKRAYKTTKAMGFQLNVEDERHFDSTLTIEQFNNDFVRKIKERAGI